MKPAYKPTNTMQTDLVTALAQAIVNAKAPDGSNPVMEALAQTTGYQLVYDATQLPAVPKHRSHNCCTTDSKYKTNGQLKATAAEPIRSLDDFRTIGDYLLHNGNVRNRQRNYTLYICGVTLGLRVSDIVRLTIGDVYDIRSGAVCRHVNIINKKTRKATTDMITPIAAKAIETLVEEIRNTQSGVLDPDWPLFQSQKWSRSGGMTNAISTDQVYTMITNAAKACGIQGHISTHSMRKTYGYIANSTMTQAGIPAAQVMETLQSKFRHADQNTTMRYIGLQQDQIDATAMCVDAALSR